MKKILALFLCLITIFPVYALDGPSEEATEPVEEELSTDTSLAANAKSAILIDAETGNIIFEKNSHEKLAPASMTKMMSMLLIMEAIENKIINWDDILTISENASSMGGSQILLENGEQMSVKDLFKGVAVASGNDAVVALAEATYGSTDEFVKAMNKKAKELGLKDTSFKNVHGLDAENHYSSAYDMAFIAKELSKHKKVFEFTSIYEDYLRKGTDREFWLVNTNKLVRFYNGVDGLKTGYTPEAMYCLTATIKKNGMRLISVVMGEPTTTIRNAETTALLNYGFAQYKSVKLLDKNKVVTSVELPKAEDIKIEVVTKEDVYALAKKNEKIGKITYEVKVDKIDLKTKIGDVVGEINVLEDGKKVKSIDLTIKEKIKKASFITMYERYLKNIIVGDIKF